METIKQENPWLVPNIDEFLFYCCPECDMKCRYGDEFLEHATTFHELAKVSLPSTSSDFDHFEPEMYMQTDDEQELKQEEDGEELDVKPNVEDLQEAIISEPLTKETKAKRKAKPSTKRSKKMKVEGDETFKCDRCDFVANNKQHLDNHYGQHIYVLHEDGSYHCESCEFTTTSKASIRNHRKRKHVYLGKFKCDICGKVMDCQASVDMHKRVKHFGELPYECDQCDFKTETNQQLKNHKMSKHGEMKNVCQSDLM